MCQLNIYAVPESVDKSKVIDILNSTFNSNIAKYCGDDFKVSGLEGYNCYFDAPMSCNCGSVISLHKEENLGLNWENLKKHLINKQVQSLKNVKKLLAMPNYYQEYDFYSKKAQELALNLRKLSIGGNSVAYNQAFEEYQKFIKEHNDILISRSYTLGAENNTIIKNIDNAIKDAKETKYAFEDNELASIKSAVNDTLNLCGEIKIFSFWQDDEDIEINDTIYATNFREEDILYLKYNDILWIKR